MNRADRFSRASVLLAIGLAFVAGVMLGKVTPALPPSEVFDCNFHRVAGIYQATGEELKRSDKLITVTQGGRVLALYRDDLKICRLVQP